MRPYTTRAVVFALAGIVWPLLLITIAVHWPGPVKPAAFGSPGIIGISPSALPPVDRYGSTMKLVIEYDPESSSVTIFIDGEDMVRMSRIFWDIPQSSQTSDAAANAAEDSP